MGNESRSGGLFGRKLEMERARDRMRWDFLEAVLKQFGFDAKFIALISQF